MGLAINGAAVNCSIKQFISILTCCKAPKPRGEPFQAWSMGLCLVGRHPVHSKGGYFIGPGLNVTFIYLCPRFPGLVPWSSYVY
jgi:hypothetical protein